jgi:hypothetical protein
MTYEANWTGMHPVDYETVIDLKFKCTTFCHTGRSFSGDKVETCVGKPEHESRVPLSRNVYGQGLTIYTLDSNLLTV